MLYKRSSLVRILYGNRTQHRKVVSAKREKYKIDMIKQKSLFVCVAIVILTRTNFCSSSSINKNEKGHYSKNYVAEILSYMNTSADSCNDFYEYACGSHSKDEWIEVFFERTEYKDNDFVENILQRSDINDLAPEYAAEFELAKQFYNNCMAVPRFSPSRPSLEYLKILKDIGGFPAVDTNWTKKNFNWIKMSAHLSNYGATSLVKEEIRKELPFTPMFSPPDVGFGINLGVDTVNDSSSEAYNFNEENMRILLSKYGVEENHIDAIITQIFKFLKRILNFMQKFDERKCSSFRHTKNVAEISEKWEVYEDIAWMRKAYDPLLCDYFNKKLDQIIERNKRAAANYLSLQFLYRMHINTAHSTSKRDICLSRIIPPMKYFFDHLYMKLYFNDEIRDEISYIVKEIRQSVRTILKEALWLDETTRKAALLKESDITVQIGRYEDTKFIKALLGELKNLHFINGSFEANYLNLRKFEKHMERFGGLVHKKYEDLGYSTILSDSVIGMHRDVLFDIQHNVIYVMAGFLNPPYYNNNWPISLKFATLGSIIGKNLMIHLSKTGADYIERKNRYWWSKNSTNAYNERSNCIFNHIKKYSVPELGQYIDNEWPQEDTIVNDGGLRASLMAYRRLALNKEEEGAGINVSAEQLFFLSFAQMFCSSVPKDKFQVLGDLSNNADFAKAYNCAVGSKMNPTSSKCGMWE